MPTTRHRCPIPGCPEITTGGPCSRHRRDRQRKQGTTTQRGYGHDYQVARAEALDGATHCWKCGDPFTESNPATGGHRVDIREGGTVDDGIEAECRRCNLGRRPAPTDTP